MMSDTMKKQLNDYYNEAYEKMTDKSDDAVKTLKFAVIITVVQSYMSSVFQAIKVSLNDANSDQSGTALVLDAVDNISQKIGKIDSNGTIDEKTDQIIDILDNSPTPSYDILKIADINIPLIETMKSDFVVMADFLKN